MDTKENLANLNPNAHEFVPLEVKAGACQKSVDYLCKMTGLETLLSLVQRHDHKGFAGASLNAPIHHHYHPVRSSLERVSASSVSSVDSANPVQMQMTPFQSNLFVPEESEEETEMFENRVRAKISGVRSQVSGVQRYSHALLYITDCGTPMRTAKLTSYEHFNEGLVQIFGNHIPAALSHVHHEFYYHLVSEKLFYRVQLSFSFDDGKNVVKFDSRYGFTDALLNVYEKFSYMLESWGYTLLDGNVHPVRPESWFCTKAPILELVGKERLIYSKQELLSIAAIQSMKGDQEDIVNAETIENFPENLRTEHVSFVSRNVIQTEKKKIPERIGHTWHRRHHRRHNVSNNNAIASIVKKEDVVVVKKIAPAERKRSEPVPIPIRSEEVIEVKRAASLQHPSSSSRGHNYFDLDRDDLSEQICIVEKVEHKDVVEVVAKKSRRRNRRKKSNNKNQEKNAEEDTSSASSSDEHAVKINKQAHKAPKTPESTSENPENAKKDGEIAQNDQKVGEGSQKVGEKEGETEEGLVKTKRSRRRRRGKKTAAKGSEEDSHSSTSSGEKEKKKEEEEGEEEIAVVELEKEEPETVQKAKRHRSRRGKRGGKRNSLTKDDATPHATEEAKPVEVAH